MNPIFSFPKEPKFPASTSVNNLETLDGYQMFKTATHDDMIKYWNPDADYDLCFFKGVCTYCTMLSCELKIQDEIIAQIGAIRFGVTVGLCAPCIRYLFEEAPKELTIMMPFSDSKDIHQTRVTIPGLKSMLVEKAYPGVCYQNVPSLTPKNRETIQSILERCAPWVEKSDRELQNPYLCKTCNNVAKDAAPKVARANAFRMQNQVAAVCLACSDVFILGGGCSMVACPSCINKTVTCVVCMGGRFGDHDLSKCSQIAREVMKMERSSPPTKLLPSIKICECPPK